MNNDILAEADKIIKGERADQYGTAEDSFELIALYWRRYIHKIIEREIVNFWEEMSLGDFLKQKGHRCITIEPHDVAMMMILLKIARTQGGTDKRDNYVDIAGYAALAARLKGFTNANG